MSQVDFARGIIVALCQYTLHVLMSQIGVNAGMNHDDSLVLEELFSGI